MRLVNVARLLGGTGLVLLALLPCGTVMAHGKEVRIALQSWVPQPDQPLTRLYEAHVTYTTDDEPVEGARLGFDASRQEGGVDIQNVAFSPLAGNPGVYVTQVQYPRFGTWDITLRTVVPGEGEATTTEHILPGSGAAAGPIRPATEQSRLTVVLQFDWRDMLNILVRWGHSAGAAVYLGMAAVLLLNLWLGQYLGQSSIWRGLTRAAFPVALASLGLIVASGVYTGSQDGPVRAPGVFDLQAMSSVAYGIPYVFAFWLKAVLGVAVLIVIMRARRRISPLGLSVDGAAARLSLTFGTLALLLLADVVVLVYLHSLSHLSALAPAR